jgi:hypothetical protein
MLFANAIGIDYQVSKRLWWAQGVTLPREEPFPSYKQKVRDFKKKSPSAARSEAAYGIGPRCSGIFYPVGDAGFVEVVGTHDHFDRVPRGDFNEIFPQFSRDVGQNPVPIFQFNPEHGSGKHGNNLAVYFDLVICHSTFCQCGVVSSGNQEKV